MFSNKNWKSWDVFIAWKPTRYATSATGQLKDAVLKRILINN